MRKLIDIITETFAGETRADVQPRVVEVVRYNRESAGHGHTYVGVPVHLEGSVVTLYITEPDFYQDGRGGKRSPGYDAKPGDVIRINLEPTDGSFEVTAR